MKNDSKQQIEYLALDALIPYARNSRTHSDAQVAQIAASIREFGFTNPVLVDADGGIIAGHGRVMAARKLGLDTVPCLRLSHLTDAQRRAYVIADNKLALNAGWGAYFYYRPATEEETAALGRIEEAVRVENEQKAALKAAQKALEDHIRTRGEFPSGPVQPEGAVKMDTSTAHGGGSWFVVGQDWIWFVRNNGMDGDNWGNNNVTTGGAGAMGWRIPYSTEVDQLISDIARGDALQDDQVEAAIAGSAREIERAATVQVEAAGQTDAPTGYASAVDALNADDHEAAALIVQKMKGDELVELGRSIGFYRQNLESVKAYKDRLTSVLPQLTKTVRETTKRKRALQDKLLDRAMEYDRAANHAEAARKNGVAEDSTAFIGFYRPMSGGETVEMHIPEMLDRLAADVQSLRSDPDFAEIGPMVENARPRVFNHRTSNQPAYRLTFDQWLDQQWAGNSYRDAYLDNANGDERKARYAAASSGGESEVSARNAYWSALMNAPRDADVSLEMYDGLTDAQKRDASRHFFRLDDLLRDRYQREAMQKKAEEDRVAREVIAPMQAEVDRLRSMNERTKSGTDAWNKRATDAANLEGLIADLHAGRITVQELPAKWRGEEGQAVTEETGKAAAQDAPYLRLLNLKSTALLSESGGRKLYAVTPTGAFRDEFFQFGRGWTLPPSNAFEFVEKGRVTGNASDNGYILIDKRWQDFTGKQAILESTGEAFSG